MIRGLKTWDTRVPDYKVQFLGGKPLFSPSELANFVACEHLTQLETSVALARANPVFESFVALVVPYCVKSTDSAIPFPDKRRCANRFASALRR
jgi:hypothetical protein